MWQSNYQIGDNTFLPLLLMDSGEPQRVSHNEYPTASVILANAGIQREKEISVTEYE